MGQAHLCAVATWSDSNQCVVFGLAVTQLFDCKSASLSFCRIPTWCWSGHGMFAQLLLRSLRRRLAHRRKVSNSAVFIMRMAASWRFPTSKALLQAKNAMLLKLKRVGRHSPATLRYYVSRKLERHFQKHTAKLAKTSRSWTDQTERLAGCLSIAKQRGRASQAKLRSFHPPAPRVHWHRELTQTNVNKQLATAFNWWLESLHIWSPREVPHVLDSRQTAVTDSDSKDPACHVFGRHFLDPFRTCLRCSLAVICLRGNVATPFRWTSSCRLPWSSLDAGFSCSFSSLCVQVFGRSLVFEVQVSD